jgi:hypothetical protein
MNIKHNKIRNLYNQTVDLKNNESKIKYNPIKKIKAKNIKKIIYLETNWEETE